ncbi:MAG: thioredoxin family protein [Rubricoccaceae bacterium]|nr:thioredoxin family protein [Rubricoccaceae bacterium]
MAVTPSTMMALGTPLPNFHLPAANPEVDGNGSDGMWGSSSYPNAEGLVVAFTCNHCPYAVDVEDRLIALAKRSQQRDVPFIAICSNNAETHPGDSFEAMARRAREKSFPFPYVRDESQDVARAFHAACTPEFYLFDSKRKLVYRGQLDDGRPGTRPTGNHLETAIDQLLAGKDISVQQVPSVGCNIKWKD